MLLYGIGVPATKTLGAFGKWPDVIAGKEPRSVGTFGTYQPNEHDLVAASYFKSGTNLTIYMAAQIAWRGKAQFDHIHDIVPWPDRPDMAADYAIPLEDDMPASTSPTGMRVIKTHLMPREIPINDTGKYFAVVRDPKSVCVSGYHFAKTLLLGPMMPNIEGWTRFFLSPRFIFGNWAEHVAGFWAMRDRLNVLFMTYEDITADLPAAVRRLADLMGVGLTPEEAATIARQCSFGEMKKVASKFDYIKTFPWSKPEGATIRRGKRGASNELLPPELQRRIDDHFRAELKRFGCDFPFDEAFAPRS